jgi:catechol 2,3-dioxygenase-like lactoylglutathione lyase family enzyme
MMEVADNGILFGLVVRDADASLDFYQNTLGMKLGWSEPMNEGGTQHYLKFKGGHLKLFAPDTAPAEGSQKGVDHTGYNLLTFVVTNIQDMCKVFDEKTVQIITPVQTTDTGVQWMIIADPEGNRIELAQTGG